MSNHHRPRKPLPPALTDEQAKGYNLDTFDMLAGVKPLGDDEPEAPAAQTPTKPPLTVRQAIMNAAFGPGYEQARVGYRIEQDDEFVAVGVRFREREGEA